MVSHFAHRFFFAGVAKFTQSSLSPNNSAIKPMIIIIMCNLSDRRIIIYNLIFLVTHNCRLCKEDYYRPLFGYTRDHHNHIVTHDNHDDSRPREWRLYFRIAGAYEEEI